MRDDFFTILEALCNLKIRITLNTNGTLITKELAKRLADYPIKSYTVSLDGASADVHDPFRGQGSFDKTLAGIQNLITEKCNVLISTTVTQCNYRDLENIVLLGKKLGATGVRFNEVVYVGNAACFNKKLVMTPQEKFGLLDKIKELRNKFGGFLSGSIIQIADIMDEIKNNCKEELPLRINSCGAATVKCTIRPDGWVTPCDVIWDITAGNLRETSLYEIWHNSPLFQELREPVEIKEKDIPECKGCEYLRLCYKGHRCRPYYNPGKLFEHKELYCWNDKVMRSA